MEDTPETKQAIISLLMDLDRLERLYTDNKLFTYKPISGQRRFHESVAPVRLVLGSNRSGKSTCGVAEAIAHSIGRRLWLPDTHPDYYTKLPDGRRIPTPNTGRIIAQNFLNITQNIFPAIQEWIPKSAIQKITYDQRHVPTKIELTNKSIIYFMSAEQDDMVFEGTKGHWAWFDEPPPYAKYIAIKRGLVDYNGACWLTLTPLTQPWIADLLASRAGEDDSQVKLFRLNIDDNRKSRGGYLPDAAVDDFIDSLREDEKEARYHGNFLHLAGRVFKEWQPNEPYWIKSFDPPPHWPRVCLIDPHERKAVAVMWIALSPSNQIHIYRDLFDDNLRTIKDVCDEIHTLERYSRTKEESSKWFPSDETEAINIRLIDTSANTMERGMGLKTRQIFAMYGINCAPVYKTERNAGIDLIHQELQIKREWQEPGIVVHDKCRHVKRNFMFYCYDEWRTQKDKDLKSAKADPRKIDDDFMDLLRYYLQKQFTYAQLRGMRDWRDMPEMDDIVSPFHKAHAPSRARNNRVALPGLI